MKLNELHIDEFGTSLISQRVSISSIFPTVAGDFVGATDPTRGQHHRFGPENFETPSLAFVPERAHDAVAMFRTVIYFNAALRNADCKVLAGELERVKFEKGGAQTRR